MARPLLRMLALAVVLVLAGSPAATAVCDATCATTERDTSAAAESTPRPHDHAASDAVGAPAENPPNAGAHAHHVQTAGNPQPGAGSQLLSSTLQDDCRRDAEISALPAAPRLDGIMRAKHQATGSTPELPAAPAERWGAYLLRHGPTSAPAFLTAPLVLRI